MLHISAPEKKYLLGIDLRGECCQISYMTNRRQRPWRNTAEGENVYGDPVTFEPENRAQKKAADGMIPICLCRSAKNDRWFIGEEAQRMAAHGDGPLIQGFLDEASFGRMIRFGTEHYNPVSLLTVFFQGVLKKLSAAVPLSQIDTVVFTSRTMNTDLEEVLRRVMKHLPVEVNHVFCEDYARSFYSYMVMQPEKIRGNASAVLDLSDEEGFYVNRVRFYTDRRPALCLPEEERVRYTAVRAQDAEEGFRSGVPGMRDGKKEANSSVPRMRDEGENVRSGALHMTDGEERVVYSTAQTRDGVEETASSAGSPAGTPEPGSRRPDELQNADSRDEALYQYLVQAMRTEDLASVFMTGAGTSGKGLKKSLDFLSRGRRTFLGNNLFSRGAAYSALLRTAAPEQAAENLYIDRNALPAGIGMKILEENGGTEEEKYHEFLKAGTSWKDARADLEVILESGRELRLVIAPVTGESPHEEILKLDGLPKRPERTSMLKIRLSMLSASELEIRVKDLGFGDIFPAAGRTWESVVSI